MGQIKDKIYDRVVRKNLNVQYEYERFVKENIVEHYKNHFQHLKVLLKIKWHYQIKKKTTPLLYWDREKKEQSNGILAQGKVVKSAVGSKNVTLERYPCVENAESKELGRQPFYRFALDLMSYELISFDIFDTLIFRPFKTPQDLFHVVAERLDFQGYHESFYVIRKNAEFNKREQFLKEYGHREVTINDIYDEIGKSTTIDPKIGAAIEFETEMELCYANPYMLEVFKILRAQGKKIAIVSDMYLPKELMEQLLIKNGFYGYDKLFVSCDYKKSKSNGNLYRTVLDEYKDIDVNKIIHIGDNLKGDIEKAKQNGITTRFYRNVNSAGGKHRPNNMSMLVGSFYGGLVNAHIHSGYKAHTVFYEFGFIYAGIYMLGMANWLNQKIITENIEQVIFLSRDGFIYKKVFDMFYGGVETKYSYWSRHAAMRYDVARTNFNEFIRRYVDSRVANNKNIETAINVGSLMETLEIDLYEEFEIYGLNEEDILDENTKEAVKKMLHDNQQKIISQYEEGKSRVLSIYKQIIGNNKRIALVDVGWTGHNVYSLKRLIEEIDNEVEIKIYLAAEKSAENYSALLDGTIDAYIFSARKNKELENVFVNKNTGIRNTVIFEMITQTTQPSYMGENGSKAVFDIPTVEDYSKFKEIEAGIVDFAKQYWSKSEKYQYLRNISSYDAIAPLRLVLQSDEYIEKYMSDFHMAVNIGANNKNQKIERIGDLF